MTWWEFAWKNIWQNTLRSLLTLLLMAVAVGLLLILQLVERQFKQHMERNLAEVDLILGAKGSPLQSVLCNMFHIDAPTGNIPLSDVKIFLRKEHPIVESAVPLSLGDNVSGFRLVGTTVEFFDWYKLKCKEGHLFALENDAVIGHEVSRALQLKLGDRFTSGHGLVKDDVNNHEHDYHFRVCGILEASNTVNDRLVMVPVGAYWHMHGHQEADTARHVSTISNAALMQADGDITSVLLKFRGDNIQSLNFGRSINENTDMMASSPPIELNRMYELTGSATDLFSSLAFVIGALALMAFFITLWQALAERKKEFALMRLAGADRLQIAWLSMAEAVLLSALGLAAAIVLAQVTLDLCSKNFQLAEKYGIFGWKWYPENTIALLVCFGLALCIATIPSMQVYRQDIHKTLTEV